MGTAMKIRLLLSLVTVLSTLAARSQDGPPALAADDSPVLVARWDVLLTEAGMDPFDQLDRKAVESASKGYQASKYDAAALRGAVNAAKSLGGIEGVNQNIAISQFMGDSYQMNQGLYFGYYGNQEKVGINGNANGDEALSPADDRKTVSLKLDYTEITLQLREPGRPQWTKLPDPLAIIFNGKLAPGEALAFRAALKGSAGQTYYHLVVWEAFRSHPRYMQNLQMVQAPDAWCRLGPDGIHGAADVATVWASRAKHAPSEVATKWERKLDDGKILRLLGVTRTDKWLFCWWDADGQPVALQSHVALSNYSQGEAPAWFYAEVRGDNDEWKRQGPTGNSGPNRQGQPTGAFQSAITSVINAKGEAVVGVAIGEWEKVGQLPKGGGTIRIGTNNYRMRALNSGGTNHLYASFQRDRGGAGDSDLITLTAVSNDGTELDPQYLSPLAVENNGMSSPNFNGMALADVKSLNVWKRKRQWVRFSDFAKEPAEPPPQQVTAAELQAVAGQIDAQQQRQRDEAVAQQLEATKARRAEWAAIPAEPTTAKGALRAMLNSAAAGDLPAVRKRLTARQPGTGTTLDLMARCITAAQSARVMAVARFGEPAVAALTVVGDQPTGLIDLEGQTMSMPWQPTPDGGMTGAEMNVVKGEGGEFYLDMSGLMEMSVSNAQALMSLRPMAERMEKVKQMLSDDPSMTLPQFKESLRNPARK